MAAIILRWDPLFVVIMKNWIHWWIVNFLYIIHDRKFNHQMLFKLLVVKSKVLQITFRFSFKLIIVFRECLFFKYSCLNMLRLCLQIQGVNYMKHIFYKLIDRQKRVVSSFIVILKFWKKKPIGGKKSVCPLYPKRQYKISWGFATYNKMKCGTVHILIFKNLILICF